MATSAAASRRDKMLKLVENKNAEQKNTVATKTLENKEREPDASTNILDTEMNIDTFRLDPCFLDNSFVENALAESSLFCHELLSCSDNEQNEHNSERHKNKNIDLSLLDSDDSCKDKDYIPDSYENSSDDENLIHKIGSAISFKTLHSKNRAEKRKKNTPKIEKTLKKVRTESSDELLNIEEDFTDPHKFGKMRLLKEVPQVRRKLFYDSSTTKFNSFTNEQVTPQTSIAKNRNEYEVNNDSVKQPTHEEKTSEGSEQLLISQEITLSESNLIPSKDQQTLKKDDIQYNTDNKRSQQKENVKEKIGAEQPQTDAPQDGNNIINKHLDNEQSQIQNFERIVITQEDEIVGEVCIGQPDSLDLEDNPQTEDLSGKNNENAELDLTKAGKPRQRRTFDKSVKERKAEKKQEYVKNHSMKTACNSLSCKKKCTTKITEEQRSEIHEQYINLNWESQGLFIKCSVEEQEVARRTQSSENGNLRRKITYKYFLKSTNLPRTEVCKTFYLTTLGYKSTNDTRLMTALKKTVDNQSIDRGKYTRTNKIDKDVIIKHVMNFNPCISHYRREHAPKKLYLPSDLTITLMHTQFVQEHPTIVVSFDYYRKVVTKDLNISFAHLGHEECEQCAYYEMHDPIHSKNPDESCEVCNNYLSHQIRYRKTRAEYKQDVELAKEDETSLYYSVDLQKVVMLPRIEQFKTAIFCPRIIAFNESFVPLGSKNNRTVVPFAAVWNETISGRHQEDIVSAFRAFLLHNRDIEHLVLWLDNCAAQNKNWTLMSFLVNIINSNTIAAKTVTLKYFEPGHSFMSADSFHHQVELALKRKGKVYDFEDFVECVRLANSKKNFVKVMDVSDFINFQDFSSQHKLRKRTTRVYLRDIMCVRVERGFYNMQYKTINEDEYCMLDFLQTKLVKNQQFPHAMSKTEPRGITEERKAEILHKLVPLMPENRRQFWRNLPISSSGADLSQDN